jgi:hypothetical protein
MVDFCQQFEMWTEAIADHMGVVVGVRPPHRASQWTAYGADPLVAQRLDFIADHIGELVTKQEDIAKGILYDLADWHNAILLRTAGADVPKYLVTMRCPKCEEFSVMKHGTGYFCGNAACCHEWVKGEQKTQG